jgi:hypothetical protein
MLPAEKRRRHGLSTSLDMLPAEPLYKRAPREDEQGKPLSDFMMIIPQTAHAATAPDPGHHTQN